MSNKEIGSTYLPQIERELEEVKKDRFLNNFSGLLPGGYRRAPLYKSTIQEVDPEFYLKFQADLELIDNAIAVLSLDPEQIEKDNMYISRLVSAEIRSDAHSVKDNLRQKIDVASNIFFDKFEFPIYEHLRRNHPDVNVDVNERWTT